jgi:6-phosphofructokinase 2
MNPTIDKNASAERVVPDRKLRCHVPRHDPGGGGINVSRAIHKLDGESTALYTQGGPAGNLLERLLDHEGIRQHPISIQDMTRENLTVLDQSADHRYRFNMPGPELSEPEWQRCLDALAELDPTPAYVVASGSLPRSVPKDFYGRVADWGHGAGCRVIVDTSEDALLAAVQAGLYLIKPNMRELGQLAGSEIETEEQQEQVAQEIIERGGAEIVVVSLGAAGVLLVADGTVERLRAPTVPIRSRIGAGDSTVAGITLALARGQPVRDAVLYGVAAGSAAVQTPGTELCRLDDTEALYARIKSDNR